MAAVCAVCGAGVLAQRAGAFGESRDHAAIAYTDGPVHNVISELNDRIAKGTAQLTFDPETGYLRSLLAALGLPIESQLLVYSETSFQAKKISRRNPRAVYFNDRVAVGWVRGGDIIEIAAQDATQGTVFYQIDQKADGSGRPTRNDKCLSCHLSWETLAVPGLQVLTVMPRRTDDEYANGSQVDHRTPIAERWAGWFVTGAKVPVQQMGNQPMLQPAMPDGGPKPVPAHATVDGEFDLRGFLTPYSDVVAHLVLEHQAHAVNLITRAGWEYRVAGRVNGRVGEAVADLVDYFLFVDEAPLPDPVRGTSGFAERFAAAGPRDAKGRSLRDLQLDTRLLRYSCSYMIYSPGFEGLPEPVKRAVFVRLSTVLSGEDSSPKYARLSAADRRATAEILRDTIPGFARLVSDRF